MTNDTYTSTTEVVKSVYAKVLNRLVIVGGLHLQVGALPDLVA